MEQTILGQTGGVISRMGFGAAELRGPEAYGGRPVSEEQCRAIVTAVLDAGITLIDTADDYGLSEERLGRYLGPARQRVFLASKCGYAGPPPDDGRNIPQRSLNRENLLEGLHRSLKRLKTDYLDLLQFHNPLPEEVIEADAVQTLLDIKKSGKVRWIGASTSNRDLPEFRAMGVFDCYQVSYSALEPTVGDAIRQVGQAGAGVLIRGCTGKAGLQKLSPRLSALGLGGPPDIWQLADLDELVPEMDRVELNLRYVLGNPHAHCLLIGTINPDHLHANLAAAAKGPLPESLQSQIEQRIATVHEEHVRPWRLKMRELVRQLKAEDAAKPDRTTPRAEPTPLTTSGQ